MSITLAAQDLCVTQSAVSRQAHAPKRTSASHCRSAATGRSRSRRKASGCVADAALHGLQDTVASRGRASASPSRSPPASASPRCGCCRARLQARLPEIDLARRRERQGTRFARRRHLGIRYCARRAPAARCACSTRSSCRSRIRSPRAVTNAAAIADHVLLEFDGPPQPHRSARTCTRSGDARPKGVLRFNQYDQADPAGDRGGASRSAGSRLVAPMLADGRLAVPPPRRPTDAYGYWLFQHDPAPRREVADARLDARRSGRMRYRDACARHRVGLSQHGVSKRSRGRALAPPARAHIASFPATHANLTE